MPSFLSRASIKTLKYLIHAHKWYVVRVFYNQGVLKMSDGGPLVPQLTASLAVIMKKYHANPGVNRMKNVLSSLFHENSFSCFSCMSLIQLKESWNWLPHSNQTLQTRVEILSWHEKTDSFWESEMNRLSKAEPDNRLHSNTSPST